MSKASPETPTRPTRVLHVVGKMDRGGVETWLMNVLRNISPDELAFDFMVLKPEAAAYDEELLGLGAGRYVCKWPNNPLSFVRNFLKILRQHGPYDVVHSHVHHFSGFILLIAKLAGVPVRIAHSHNDTSNVQSKSSLFRHIYFIVTKNLINITASSGVAVSEKAASSLFGNNWKNNGNNKVLYCGIDFKPFEISVSKHEVRKKMGIPQEAFVIGHVGRFDEQKNHSFLVEIFSKIVLVHPNAVLLLIGDGKLKQEIQHKVREFGLEDAVMFAGVRTDIPKIMKGAMDIFVFPSVHEGLPITLIEAQLSHLRIIMSDNIAAETELSNLITTLSLDKSAKEWADVILSAEHVNPPIFFGIDDFSIESSIENLRTIYYNV